MRIFDATLSTLERSLDVRLAREGDAAPRRLREAEGDVLGPVAAEDHRHVVGAGVHDPAEGGRDGLPEAALGLGRRIEVEVEGEVGHGRAPGARVVQRV